MNNCLTCRYEPDWSEEFGKDYPRRTGSCKWDLHHIIPLLPKIYTIHKTVITKHADNSGVMTNCPTYKSKDNSSSISSSAG